MQICGGFYYFFLSMSQGCQHTRLYRSPCQKCRKAETFYFCSHYQNLVELNPPQKSPDSFQGHTPSSAILLKVQLIDKRHHKPPWECCLSERRFCFMDTRCLTPPASRPSCAVEYQVFCARAICARVNREGICFSGRKAVHCLCSQRLGYKPGH